MAGWFLLQFMMRVVFPIGIGGLTEASSFIVKWLMIYAEFMLAAIIVIPISWWLIIKLTKAPNLFANLAASTGIIIFNSQINGWWPLVGISGSSVPYISLTIGQWLGAASIFYLSFLIFAGKSHNKLSKRDAVTGTPS